MSTLSPVPRLLFPSLSILSPFLVKQSVNPHCLLRFLRLTTLNRFRRKPTRLPGRFTSQPRLPPSLVRRLRLPCLVRGLRPLLVLRPLPLNRRRRNRRREIWTRPLTFMPKSRLRPVKRAWARGTRTRPLPYPIRRVPVLNRSYRKRRRLRNT